MNRNIETSETTVRQPNKLLHGNCIELLKRVRSGSIDFVLTDPPYLVNYSSSDGRTVPNDDNDAWLKPAFAEVYRVLCWNRFAVVFYGWNKADNFITAWREVGFHIVGHLTFIKKYASRERYLKYAHENAYLLAKGNPQKPLRTIPDVLEYHYSGNRLHPTQKPVSALLPLISSFSNPGGTTLDPFCGSGSTLVAAQQLGRHFVGMELDARYHTIAQQRLNAKAA
jgi:DNA modification methylase